MYYARKPRYAGMQSPIHIYMDNNIVNKQTLTNDILNFFKINLLGLISLGNKLFMYFKIIIKQKKYGQKSANFKFCF